VTRHNKQMEQIVNAISQSGDKPAHPDCRQFRVRCWLPHPQPDCVDCKYL